MLKSSHIRALKKLAPFLALTAVIPVFVLAVTSTNEGPVSKLFKGIYNLQPRAAQLDELRVWLEPATLHLSPGQSGEVWVMARFSPEGKLLPDLAVLVQTENNKVRVTPTEVHMSSPFYGQIRVGKITVTAPYTTGSYSVAPVISLQPNQTQETQLKTSTGTILVN